MVNRISKTLCIFRLASLHAISPHGIIPPAVSPVVHDLETGQIYAGHDTNLLERPSGHPQGLDDTSIIPQSLNGHATRGDFYPAHDFPQHHELTDWDEFHHNWNIMESFPTQSAAREHRVTSEHPTSSHISKTSSSDLSIEDYGISTLDSVGLAGAHEQSNWHSIPIHFGGPHSLPTTSTDLNYGDSLHSSNYATGPKRPTNLIEEPISSNSPPLKRKIIDNLNGSPSKQIKIPFVDLVEDDQEATRIIEPNGKPKDWFLTHHRQDLLRAPQEEVVDQKKIVDMFNVNLKIYGMLNTLRFPGPKLQDSTLFFHDLLHGSYLWKSLQGYANDSTLPMLIRRVIQYRRVSKETVLVNARNLLDEICLRHGQILIAFTYSGTAVAQSDKIDELRTNEQEKLLAWLIKLFNRERPPTPSHLYSEEDSTASELQDMVFNYLNRENTKSVYLETKTSQKRPWEKSQVTHDEAMKTQVAINALGIHFKHSNPNKWIDLFLFDDDFVKILVLLSNRERARTLSTLKNHLYDWEKLQVFPWDNTEILLQNDSEKKSILDDFKGKIERASWEVIERNCEEVAEPIS
ncbi:hypothetical protein MJO28_000581 [Puccinia striiformis f. sp. tritici]|uniref:Uncharacterized protein n=2 Tax=Puccinia striiformis f. sp. tritici TaxID=168172 RepID=A0A0L0W5T7_9BASI|nr:hypothetical protein Pst134EB_001862 [Puccinia striiformis f. sp. tritici]KAI7962487.1 hypothetical protein MJO28_000581 [Puccinia striiformis f. sp. tritici]KNF06847.1 hypothetical protein PSTG_00160 [Puccinia striiformis f. sp. tritici PST-78]